MDIWYQFALVCGIIIAVGLWAGLSKDKNEEKGANAADKAA